MLLPVQQTSSQLSASGPTTLYTTLPPFPSTGNENEQREKSRLEKRSGGPQAANYGRRRYCAASCEEAGRRYIHTSTYYVYTRVIYVPVVVVAVAVHEEEEKAHTD